MGNPPLWLTSPFPGQRGDHLEVLESLSLGPKRGVSLLRVGGQFVLVGHNEQSMAALVLLRTQASPLASSQQGEAAAGMQQIVQSTGQSAQACASPASANGQRGRFLEASSELPSQGAHDQPTTTDSVDDFRQRLNRLLGGALHDPLSCPLTSDAVCLRLGCG